MVTRELAPYPRVSEARIPEEVGETKWLNLTSLQRKVASAVGAVLVTASFLSGVGKVMDNDATGGLEVAASLIVDRGGEMSPLQLEQVGDEVLDVYESPDTYTYDSMQKAMFDIREKATEIGLTLPNYLGYSEDIDSAETKTEILTQMHEYAEELGLSLKIGTEATGLKSKAFTEAYDIEAMSLEELRDLAADFGYALWDKPAEVFESADVKRIALVEQARTLTTGNAGGYASMMSDLIVINAGQRTENTDIMEAVSMKQAISHELGHLIDSARRGTIQSGIFDDQEFEELTGQNGFSYGDTSIATVIGRDDAAEALAAETFISYYGATNTSEEIAEGYDTILSGKDSDVINPIGETVADKKVRILLARLEETTPGIARLSAIISSFTLAEGALLETDGTGADSRSGAIRNDLAQYMSENPMILDGTGYHLLEPAN